MRIGPAIASMLIVSAALAADAPADPSPAPAASAGDSAAAAPPVLPDEALLKTIEQVRKSPVGYEANAMTYLNLIAAGQATAPQVNDFAAYLAKRGMPRIALSFQEYAVKLDGQDPTLWMNLGTIRRTIGALGPAASAFKSAIALDPTIAMAHYNLGAVYDADKKYDDAIEEYRRSLILDPDLADPRKNPQVVNNELLLAVKLRIYTEQAGAMGLPLLQKQKVEPPQAPKPSPSDKPN
jgi:tetratricopeptide (TPR) repeat protein